MQKTRQKILNYLKQNEEATVDELCKALGSLTAVTVRHHLDTLRAEDLIEPPAIQHRDSPGRPKYIYRLTKKGESMFPRNFNALTVHMVNELKQSLNDQQINVIFEGIADRMAADLPPGIENESVQTRLERVIIHLTEHGYDAFWESHDEGFLLYTSNCPYGNVAESHEELCTLDMKYISRLLGRVPRRMDHKLDGDHHCTYLIPQP